VAAETAGCPMNTDERLLVSPMGQQEVLTVSVVIPNKIEVDNKQTREDEDEHIDRLVQESRDDNKSVRSFGKRTDVPIYRVSICTRVNLRGRDQEGPLKKAIQRYIGDYEALWSLLLEPSEHFEVEEGQIPCPRDLGSVGRRMVSVMDVRDKPSVHNWNGVVNREKFMTKEQMVLSYEIYLVAKQIKKSSIIKKTYAIPSNEGIELTNE